MTQIPIPDILPYTQSVSTFTGQVIYSTTWTADAASDVVVYSRAAGVDADDETQILDISLYSVAFIGSGNIVQVTLINASTIGDIVTITRMTPADRLNLYSNTNFTPNMLNNDFGILTLVDQQAQLVNQLIAPRYNYSALIDIDPTYPTVDTILPILGPDQIWIKNPANTAIIAATIDTTASGTVNLGLANQLAYYAVTGNEVTGLTTANNGVLITSAVGVPSISSVLPAGLTTTNPSVAQGIATKAYVDSQVSGSDPLTTKGDLFTFTTVPARLPVGTVDGQILQVSSGASTGLAWSTATYPLTTTINQLLFSSGTNTIVGLSTAVSSVLVTDSGGIPSLSTVLPGGLTTTDPTLTQGLATKNYVDKTALNGTSVYAASAATLGTVTQSGSGVGATLTNAGAQATFALDGVNPPVGTNVLIKNTATGMTAANEGIYTLTNVGSSISNWILTRATSYDTTTEINNTGLILVQNGSTLAGTAWYNSATIVTIDTTNFNYTQFGNITFPVTLANGGTNASLTASNGGIFYSTASAGAILAGTATAGRILQSGATAAPSWSTATYPSVATGTGSILRANGTNWAASSTTFPDTVAINSLLYANSANTMTALTPAANGVLVSANSSQPIWLAGPGTAGSTLLSQGAAAPIWSTNAAITRVNTQAITATGAFSYTPTTGTQYAIFELQGAGGGSGGATGTAGQTGIGSGGAGGAYIKLLVTGAANLAAITGSVGTGGTAGASGNNNGGAGGNTTLVINSGSTWTAAGGALGVGGASSAAAGQSTSASGGAPTNGTNGTVIIAMSGEGNSWGLAGAAGAVPLAGSKGGSSFYGRSNVIISPGSAGTGYGAGASGGVSLGSNIAGAVGAPGIVIITEFISA